MEREIVAAVARRPGAPFSLERLVLDGPWPDEVLVRIEGAGVCHTDLVAKDTDFPPALPAVLGHEGAGVVEAVGGDVEAIRSGERVILSFASCGICRECVRGTPGYCDAAAALNYAGARLDGGRALRGPRGQVASHFFGQSCFATHAVVTPSNIVPAPDDAPLALLGPFGCSIQTGAGTVLNVFRAEEGDSILIAGAGAVGLSAVMAARLIGCGGIIVSDPLAARRAIALELGATHVVDPASERLVEAVKAVSRRGVAFALDTTGRRNVLEDCIESLGKRGVLACVGIASRENPAFEVSIDGLLGFGRRIAGVIEGDSDPTKLIPRLLAAHRAGRFPFERLIKTYPLREINEAIADQAAGRCVKPVLLTSEEAAAMSAAKAEAGAGFSPFP